MIDYKQKYLKYKIKYLNEKRKIELKRGGMEAPEESMSLMKIDPQPAIDAKTVADRIYLMKDMPEDQKQYVLNNLSLNTKIDTLIAILEPMTIKQKAQEIHKMSQSIRCLCILEGVYNICYTKLERIFPFKIFIIGI